MKQSKPKTKIQVLTEYFGKQPGQKVADFHAEIKKLSEEERLELAREAATTLGYDSSQVGFPLR